MSEHIDLAVAFGRGGFTGISNAEICSGFPPSQAALRIILSNDGEAVYINR